LEYSFLNNAPNPKATPEPRIVNGSGTAFVTVIGRALVVVAIVIGLTLPEEVVEKLAVRVLDAPTGTNSSVSPGSKNTVSVGEKLKVELSWILPITAALALIPKRKKPVPKVETASSLRFVSILLALTLFTIIEETLK
jgi:hypothetical protein